MSSGAWKRLEIELKAPEEYCVSNTEKAQRLKEIVKTLFELASTYSARGTGPLKSVLIDGIDEETLWEQLQTRNNPLLKYIRKYLKTSSKKTLEFIPLENDEDEEGDETSEDISNESYGEDMNVDENEDGEEEEEEDDNDDSKHDSDEDEDEDEEDSASYDSDDVTEEERIPKERTVKSNTDDGWNTDEELGMEAWLDATEELDNQHREKLENREKRAKANTLDQWDDEEDDEEDDLDIVEKAMYGSGDEEEDEDFDPSSIRYEDFYADEKPTALHKLGKVNASQNKNKRKAVDIDDSSEDDEDEEDESDFGENAEDDYVDSEEEEEEEEYNRPSQKNSKKVSSAKQTDAKNTPVFLTSYQRRLQELSTQIKELEQELIAEKSWEMRGEVAAQHRPENSLLDMAVDVDRATKVAPIITQEYTSTLEDLIIKRIQDEKFDDPRPRNAMAEVLTAEPGDDKDPIELSQEKSKLGLAEIYAEDYAKKMLNSDDKLSVETQALREEVVGLFGAVSRHLDALCHFYFTPRPVAGETSAKVLATQRALPALELEDIAPFSANSDATKAAPEELLAKKKGPRIMLLSSEELGRDDRKKRRRVKKELRRAEKRQADAALDSNVKRARREEAVLSRDKRVSVHDSSSSSGLSSKKRGGQQGEFSKSTTFFSNLQKDVEANVQQQSAKTGSKHSRANTTEHKSSSFKL